MSRYFASTPQIVRAPFQNADLDQPYRLRSNFISSLDSLTSANAWVDKVRTNGTWLTISVHGIVDSVPGTGTEWPAADWNALVDYVAASGVEVMPVGAALDRITANQLTKGVAAAAPATPSPVTAVRRAAVNGLNNVAVLAPDPELSVPVVVGGVYHVEGFLIYSFATTADLSIGWT